MSTAALTSRHEISEARRLKTKWLLSASGRLLTSSSLHLRLPPVRSLMLTCTLDMEFTLSQVSPWMYIEPLTARSVHLSKRYKAVVNATMGPGTLLDLVLHLKNFPRLARPGEEKEEKLWRGSK
jgi:hypothetical protein